MNLALGSDAYFGAKQFAWKYFQKFLNTPWLFHLPVLIFAGALGRGYTQIKFGPAGAHDLTTLF